MRRTGRSNGAHQTAAEAESDIDHLAGVSSEIDRFPLVRVRRGSATFCVVQPSSGCFVVVIVVVSVVFWIDALVKNAEVSLIVPASIEEDRFPSVAVSPHLYAARVLVQPTLDHRVLLVEIKLEEGRGTHD